MDAMRVILVEDAGRDALSLGVNLDNSDEKGRRDKLGANCTLCWLLVRISIDLDMHSTV